MNPKNNNRELIRRFLLGQLSGEDLRAFNKKIQEDPKLAEYLRWQLAFDGAMEDLAWDQERDEWRREVLWLRWKRRFVFIFAILFIGFLIWFFLFSKRSDKIIGSSGEKEKIASDGILINYEKNKLSESDGFLWDALKRRSDRFFEERSSSSELTRLALVSRFRERLKEPLFRENILIDISKNKNILFDPNNRKWKELWLSGDFDRCLQELNRLEVESESNWTFLFFPAEYYHSSILTLYLFEFGPGDPSVFDNLNDIYLYLQKNPSLRKFAPDIELHLLACELIYEKQSSDVSLNELFESDPLLGDRIDRLLSTFYF